MKLCKAFSELVASILLLSTCGCSASSAGKQVARPGADSGPDAVASLPDVGVDTAAVDVWAALPDAGIDVTPDTRKIVPDAGVDRIADTWPDVQTTRLDTLPDLVNTPDVLIADTFIAAPDTAPDVLAVPDTMPDVLIVPDVLTMTDTAPGVLPVPDATTDTFVVQPDAKLPPTQTCPDHNTPQCGNNYPAYEDLTTGKWIPAGAPLVMCPQVNLVPYAGDSTNGWVGGTTIVPCMASCDVHVVMPGSVRCLAAVNGWVTLVEDCSQCPTDGVL